jgi:hypothetical protein
MKTRILPLALALVVMAGLLAGLTGCKTDDSASSAPPSAAPTGSASAAPVDPPAELVTLDVFSMRATTSGLQDNSYWADILKRDLNVQLNLLPAGDEAV